MKRILILATAALAIAGCSGELPFDHVTVSPSDIVAFSIGPVTRGTPVSDASELADIGTFGYHTGHNNWTEADLPDRMFNRRLYRDGAVWKYNGTPARWDGSSASDLFTFYAYAPYASAENGIVVNGNASSPGVPTLTYTVPADVTEQPDIMVAVPRVDIVKPAGGYVSLTMEHALTTVGFQVAGHGEQIAGISISGVSMTGTLKIDGNNIVWSDLGTPSTADFSASINFDEGQNYYTATTSMSTDLMQGGGYLMMIPQTLGSSAMLTVTYADATTLQISLDTHRWLPGKKVTYELTIVPGGVILVEPANISMPPIASKSQITVDCSDGHDNPAPSLPWTLTTNRTWLTLSFNSDGTDADQTLSGTSSQTVYVFAAANATSADRTAAVALDDTENVVTNVMQHYSMAQRFARSNIVMYDFGNGNKVLTFAEAEIEHQIFKIVTYYNTSMGANMIGMVPAIPANVQGLHFRWGSLVGVTSNGTSGQAFNSSHVVFWPTEYTPPGTWVFSGIPYTSGSDIGGNPNSGTAGLGLDGFAGYPGGTGPGFDKAAAKGDICRYISEMGWVNGKWRMPTSSEIIALLDETPVGYNGRVWGYWDEYNYETIGGTGTGNKYGYYPLSSVRAVGKGVTGQENATNSLPNPGAAKVVFPAAGYRDANSGSLSAPGFYAHHWSATPATPSSAYDLDYNGWNNFHSWNMFDRTCGYSVRCIMAE